MLVPCVVPITLEMKELPMVCQQYPGFLMFSMAAWVSDVTSFSLDSHVESIIGFLATMGKEWLV